MFGTYWIFCSSYRLIALLGTYHIQGWLSSLVKTNSDPLKISNETKLSIYHSSPQLAGRKELYRQWKKKKSQGENQNYLNNICMLFKVEDKGTEEKKIFNWFIFLGSCNIYLIVYLEWTHDMTHPQAEIIGHSNSQT